MVGFGRVSALGGDRGRLAVGDWAGGFRGVRDAERDLSRGLLAGAGALGDNRRGVLGDIPQGWESDVWAQQADQRLSAQGAQSSQHCVDQGGFGWGCIDHVSGPQHARHGQSQGLLCVFWLPRSRAFLLCASWGQARSGQRSDHDCQRSATSSVDREQKRGAMGRFMASCQIGAQVGERIDPSLL